MEAERKALSGDADVLTGHQEKVTYKTGNKVNVI